MTDGQHRRQAFVRTLTQSIGDAINNHVDDVTSHMKHATDSGGISVLCPFLLEHLIKMRMFAQTCQAQYRRAYPDSAMVFRAKNRKQSF